MMLGQDKLGYPVTLKYKGNDSHPTILGALLSIGIKIMVLVYLTQLFLEMVTMNEPEIQSYERPFYKEEIKSFSKMKMIDHDFSFGIYLYTDDPKTGAEKPLPLPASLGRFITHSMLLGVNREETYEPLDHDCESQF